MNLISWTLFMKRALYLTMPLLSTLLLSLPQFTLADRTRHCDAKLTMTYTHSNAQQIQTQLTGIKTAGWHGGILANTARKRARNRLIECFGSWVDDGNSAANIANCNNAHVSGGDRANDFESKIGNRTLDQYVASICDSFIDDWKVNRLSTEKVVYTANGSGQVGLALDIWGDNRCSSGTIGGNRNISDFYAFCDDMRGGAWSQHGDSDGIPNFRHCSKLTDFGAT